MIYNFPDTSTSDARREAAERLAKYLKVVRILLKHEFTEFDGTMDCTHADFMKGSIRILVSAPAPVVKMVHTKLFGWRPSSKEMASQTILAWLCTAKDPKEDGTGLRYFSKIPY